MTQLGDRQLSPHFRVAEFAEHTGRMPPAHYLTWMRRLCLEYLEPLRDAFGPVTIVSGWRSPSYNAGVGGAPQSYHLGTSGRQGSACDLHCLRGGPNDWYGHLDRRGIPGLGLYAGWVHADNRLRRARW